MNEEQMARSRYVDPEGVEWLATDPWPLWFRRDEHDEIIHMPYGSTPRWDKATTSWVAPPPEPQPCSRTCRRISFSSWCECQGWCL